MNKQKLRSIGTEYSLSYFTGEQVNKMKTETYSLEDFLKPSKRKQLKRVMKCDCCEGSKVGHERNNEQNWVCNMCGNEKVSQ